jgi:hypothetical protein
VTNSLLSCAFLSIANTLPMKIPILFHFEGCTWNLQLTNHFTVPLVVIFTKFDGLVIQELAKLDNNMDWKDRFLKEAEDNAKKMFQQVYESSVMSTECPPKVHVVLGGG